MITSQYVVALYEYNDDKLIQKLIYHVGIAENAEAIVVLSVLKDIDNELYTYITTEFTDPSLGDIKELTHDRYTISVLKI